MKSSYRIVAMCISCQVVTDICLTAQDQYKGALDYFRL